jgi:hypothetical protein
MHWSRYAVPTLAALLTVGEALAAPVTWTLTGATFDDGTVATGSFVYNAATNAYSNWHVFTQASPVLSAFTYDNTTSFTNFTTANHVLFATNIRYITMLFAANMTDAGGTINIALTPGGGTPSNGSYECNNCGSVRWFTGGAITAAAPQAVPEPTSMALLLGVLPLMALMRRRRT